MTSRYDCSPTTRADLFAAVADGLLADGIGIRFRAGGRSMSPTVRDGEYLIVEPTDPARVDIGDIVLGRARRGPIAHRVVAIDARPDGALQYTLCGDASQDCDRPISAAELRGSVTSVERDGRTVSLAIAGGWLGRLAFLIVLRLRRAIQAARARGPVAGLAPAGAPR